MFNTQKGSDTSAEYLFCGCKSEVTTITQAGVADMFGSL